MIKVGIIGSTGYAGQQLTWLVYNHPKTELVFLSSHSNADKNYSQIYPQYNGFIQDKCTDISNSIEMLNCIDILFLALPHGKSFEIVQKAINKNIKVIDLSADFRLENYSTYNQWYKVNHKCSNLLNKSVYGLPELHKEKIKNAKLIANPGCYPTASILALSPLVKNDILDLSTIIIDAKSGVSGAGRKTNLSTHYPECNESIKAYGVATHRHTPEIEQELSNMGNSKINLSFTPHLIPMNRGILATCYATSKHNLEQKEILELYNEFYKNEPFIRIINDLPQTRFVKGSNLCDITVRTDKRTGRIIVISAIDNLIKGAAGQAVQNMNLIFNLNEDEGLNIIPLAP